MNKQTNWNKAFSQGNSIAGSDRNRSIELKYSVGIGSNFSSNILFIFSCLAVHIGIHSFFFDTVHLEW